LDESYRFRSFGFAPAGYNNVRATFGEPDGRRPPNAGGSAGD
jgi:hypothetical protein